MLLTWAASQGANAPGFAVALQSSLTPSQALGSPTASFSRASAAEHIDFEAIHRQVPAGAFRPQGSRYVRNWVSTRSEDFSNAVWQTFGGTTKDGAAPIADPKGGNTAYQITLGTTGGAFSSSSALFAAVNSAPCVIGNKHAPSIYVYWVSGPKFVRIGYNDSVGNPGSADIAIDTGWRRIGFTGTDTATGASNNMSLRAPTTPGGVSTVVYVAFAQFEDVTGQTLQVPGDYVPVLATANPDSGAIGVRHFQTLNGNTVASNVVTEATGPAISSSHAECAGGVTAGVVDASGPLGYLSEGAHTQYLGVTSAPATQTTGSLSTGTYTLSVVGSGTATPSGGTATITGAAAASAAAPNTFTVTVAGTVTVTVSGSLTFFQLENSAFKSSQIQNAGAAGTSVTRAADVLTYPAAGNVSGTQGSASAEVAGGTATGRILDLGNTRLALYDGATGTHVSIFDGTVGGDVGAAWSLPLASVTKIASFWGNGLKNTFASGSSGVANAFDGDMNVGASFTVGVQGDGPHQFPWYGTIRNLRLYPQPLSAARMVAMTSP